MTPANLSALDAAAHLGDHERVQQLEEQIHTYQSGPHEVTIDIVPGSARALRTAGRDWEALLKAEREAGRREAAALCRTMAADMRAPVPLDCTVALEWIADQIEAMK